MTKSIKTYDKKFMYKSCTMHKIQNFMFKIYIHHQCSQETRTFSKRAVVILCNPVIKKQKDMK